MLNNGNKMISRDLKRILCASSIFILVLLGVMVFSPLASQFDDEGLSRGMGNEWELDSLVDAKEYQTALDRVDSIITEKGRDLMNQEFGDEGTTYFSILQLIASGLNRRSDIDGAMQKDMGTFLQNLEKNFNVISRLKPILAKPNSKTTAYEISDQFLRFWFRFVWPYQSLVERKQLSLLRQNIGQHYEQFTGRTLEQYYQQAAMESGRYTLVGNWWDRKGKNEIDMIALNEFDHTGIVAEIKRNPRKLSLTELERRVSNLPPADFGPYNLSLQTLSIEDM